MTGFSVVAEIGVTSGAIDGIAAAADGKRLVATNHRGGSVSVIDTAACAVVSTIVGIPEPFAVACAGRDRAYVRTASAAYDAIAAIDLRANTVVGVQPVAFSVTDLAISPDSRHVYGSRTGAARADVVVLDTRTGETGTVDIAGAPGTTADNVRISPDGRRLYASAQAYGSGQLVVVDTRTRRIAGSIEIGSSIRDVALSPSGATAYVVSCSPDFGAVLDVVDTRTNMIGGTAKIDGVGDFVTQLALSRDGHRAYLVSDLGVTVLSTSMLDVIGSITTSNQPSCVVENLDGSCLYVADYSGAVTVFSVAPPVARGEDGDTTDRHQWALPELFELEPALL